MVRADSDLSFQSQPDIIWSERDTTQKLYADSQLRLAQEVTRSSETQTQQMSTAKPTPGHSTLRRKNKKLQSKVQSLTQTNESLEARHKQDVLKEAHRDDLESRIRAHVEEKNRLEGQIKSDKLKNDRLLERIEFYTLDNDRLLERIEVYRLENDELLGQVRSCKLEKDTLRSQLQLAREVQAGLKRELEAASNVVEATNITIEQLVAGGKEKDGLISALRLRYQALQSQVVSSTKARKKTDEELAALRAKKAKGDKRISSASSRQ